MRNHIDERGATALLVAGALFFIFGAAALAVDTSSFYADARADQTTADMACLSGAFELPDTAAAIATAAEIAQLNWPEKTLGAPVIVGTTATMTDGAGNVVTIDAAHNGNSDEMSVTVSERSETEFGAVLGASSVNVVQQGICEANKSSGGGGTLPFGAITGGWTGPLQISPPCGPSSGNCGALSIPRDDTSGAGNTLIKNISDGSDRMLAGSLGASASATACTAVSAGDTCHIVDTDTGVSASHLGNGFFDRLDGDPGATCTFPYKGGTLNCDTPTQILGSGWTPLMTAFPAAPSWWDTRLYGAYNATNTNRHFWYDGVVAKCDSPRRGAVPIVTENLNWDLGDAHTGWPNGKKAMKIVGMLDVIVEEPYSSGDFQGNKNLKTASASVIWYGPNAVCANGAAVGVLNGVPAGSGSTAVKLIAG
jgi:hypothetical protein